MRIGKALAPVAVCAALAVTLATAGTLAYLTDRDSRANVFTVGNVAVELTETDTRADGDSSALTNSYEMRRAEGGGWEPIAKDPTVTVAEGSADCWLFVKLVESDGFDGVLSYSVDEGDGRWAPLEGEAGVWYRQVLTGDDVREFEVIEGSKLEVIASEEKVRELEESGSRPTLSVRAYAVQAAGLDAAGAWALVGE